MPRCSFCETGLRLEKFAFLQLNRRPPSAISSPTVWRAALKCNLETTSFMLAQVRNLRTIVIPVLLCAFVVGMTSCATQKDTALVKDANDRHDTLIPWNKKESRATQAQVEGM